MTRALVLLACVGCAAPAGAQVSLGLRAGYSATRLSATGLAPNAHRPGVTLGAFAEVPVGRGVSVRPEVAYVQKGNRTYGSRSDFDVDTRVLTVEETVVETRADYLEVPLLLHATSPAGGRFRVGAMAGPPVAFRTRVGAVIGRRVNGESAPYEPGTVVVATNPARLDVGLVAGGDIAFGPVALDVRYTAGLTGAEAVRPSARFGAVSVALSARRSF